MPSTASTLHTNRPLANFALSYSPGEFIADRVLPVALVENVSDSFYVRSKTNQTRYIDGKIGSLDTPPEIDTNATTDTFACQDYGWIAKVALKEANMADVPLALEQNAVLDAMAMMYLAREVRVATLLTTSANYDSGNVQTLSGASQWNASNGNGDIFGVIETARASIWRAPNTRLVAFCGYQVWQQLKNHPQFIDRIKGGATKQNIAAGAELKKAFADAIEVSEFYVAESRYTASNAGATASYSRIWGKHFGVLAIPDFPSTRSLGFGLTFRWNAAGSQSGINVADWFEPGPGTQGAKKFKVTHSDVEKVCANDAGALIVNAVA